jgi:ankyrin repeat protein
MCSERDSTGRMPFHWAAKQDNVNIIMYMVMISFQPEPTQSDPYVLIS